MKDAVKVIRREMFLLCQLGKVMDGLNEALLRRADAAGVRNSVRQMEAMLSELGQAEKDQRQFLETKSQNDMHGFVKAQPASQEKDAVERLLLQVGNLQNDLKRKRAEIEKLLKNEKKFVDYNINVMNQTQAGSIYGPPGGSSVELMRGRKMFEADV